MKLLTASLFYYKLSGRILSFFLLFLTFFTFALPNEGYSQWGCNDWNNVGNAGFTPNDAEWLSLAIDGSGTPYLAYLDAANNYKASVMKYNGSSWVQVGSPGFSDTSAMYTSIAIDVNGTPYVAYTEYDSLYGYSGSKASVMKYNGAAWVQVGTAGFTVEVSNTTLAIDGSGTPYVAYRDWGNNGKVSVMKYNGSAWVQVGAAGFTPYAAELHSLAIDGNGTPYVAYVDWGNNNKASVMKYNGSAWVQVGIAGFSPDQAVWPSLTINGNGIPYVAYKDWGNNGKVSVMKYDGSAWVQVGTAGFSADNANYTSLAIDGNNTPYVAYQDFANGYKASVMKYNGSAWVQVGTAGFSVADATYITVKTDNAGIPYIAYMDGANNNKATVMKYAASAVIPTIALSAPVGAATGNPVTVNATVTNAGSSYTIHWMNHGVTFATTNVPPATGNSITYTKGAGTDSLSAKVVVTGGGCYDSATSTVTTVSATTGISYTTNDNSIQVYPNPTDNLLYIGNINETTPYQLQSVMGTTILQGAFTQEHNTLLLKELPVGMYQLQLTDATGRRDVVRVVKE